MPTYLLLDASSINALIIITLLFEPVLNKVCCLGVARTSTSSVTVGDIAPLRDKKLNTSAIAEHGCEVLRWKT